MVIRPGAVWTFLTFLQLGAHFRELVSLMPMLCRSFLWIIEQNVMRWKCFSLQADVAKMRAGIHESQTKNETMDTEVKRYKVRKQDKLERWVIWTCDNF